MKKFYDTFIENFKQDPKTILDIVSRNMVV